MVTNFKIFAIEFDMDPSSPKFTVVSFLIIIKIWLLIFFFSIRSLGMWVGNWWLHVYLLRIRSYILSSTKYFFPMLLVLHRLWTISFSIYRISNNKLIFIFYILFWNICLIVLSKKIEGICLITWSLLFSFKSEKSYLMRNWILMCLT